MTEYIKREDVIEAFYTATGDGDKADWAVGVIKSISSADVVERKKGKWIPVTERLPCLTTPVLATDGIEVDIAWMYGVPPRWITSFTAIDEDKLTHWMPLPKTPQPPKEE